MSIFFPILWWELLISNKKKTQVLFFLFFFPLCGTLPYCFEGKCLFSLKVDYKLKKLWEKKQQLKNRRTVKVNHRGELGLEYEQCACQYCDLPQASGYLSPIFHFLFFPHFVCLVNWSFWAYFFVNENNYTNNNNIHEKEQLIWSAVTPNLSGPAH